MEKRLVDLGHLRLNVHEWSGDKTPFVLLHGLASNAHTWTAVAHHLAAAGHHVFAVDQRGHGRSDKPDSGYGFDAVTADLLRLLDVLELAEPIVAGQSWGGNVVLAFGARYPDRARGLVFVDGGTIDMQARPGATWERIAVDLRPPNLIGTPYERMKAMMHRSHPDWDEAGIVATLNNFETLPDGTIRPWLTLERHMEILRALWEQRPQTLYPQVAAPVLIVKAGPSDDPWGIASQKQVAAAEALLAQSRVHWLPNTDHDIHVHRPQTLADLMLTAVADGFWPA